MRKLILTTAVVVAAFSLAPSAEAQRQQCGPVLMSNGQYKMICGYQPTAIQAYQRLRRLMAAHRSVRELVEIGAYVSGTDPDADRALELMPRIDDFLRQSVDAPTPSEDTWRLLHDLVGAA